MDRESARSIQWMREQAQERLRTFQEKWEEALRQTYMYGASSYRAAVELPMPYCAHCGGGKIVDRIQRINELRTDCVIFRVWCHGDEDTCRITQLAFANMKGKLERGYAFTAKRIEG